MGKDKKKFSKDAWHHCWKRLFQFCLQFCFLESCSSLESTRAYKPKPRVCSSSEQWQKPAMSWSAHSSHGYS